LHACTRIIIIIIKIIIIIIIILIIIMMIMIIITITLTFSHRLQINCVPTARTKISDIKCIGVVIRLYILC
jgi:hypothetical protein